MGKATITGGGANGLYNISIKYDNARAKARLDAINSQLDQLNNTLIPQALDNKNIAQAQHQVALGYLNDYLNSVTPEQFDPSISGRLTVQAMQTKSVYDEANKAYKKLVLQETALQKEKTKLQNVPEDEAAQAWCADFTEDLTGDVGVIDVGYEDKDIRIIKPHAIEGSGYNAASDGIISSFFNHTAHQLYTNRAYLPAMAKWKPRYRIGTLTAKSGDTGSVSLDALSSSQQSINVNQTSTLTNVPIQYMTCDGDAFEVGDRVVVEFNSDWSTPKVIGFESNPKECTQWPSYIEYKLDMSPPPILNTPGVCSDVISAGPIDYHYIAKDFDPDNPNAPAYRYGVFEKSEATESLFVGTLAIENTDFEVIEFASYQNGAVVYSCTGTYVDWGSIAEGQTAHYEVYGMLNMDSIFFDTSLDVRKNTVYPYVIRGYDTASGHFIQTKITPPEILALLSQPRTTTILTLKNTLTGKTRQYEYYTSTQWLTVRTFRYWIKPI